MPEHLTTRRRVPLTRPGKLAWALLATVALIGAGIYLDDQYSAATVPTSLTDLPEYPFANSAVPLSSVPPQQRSEAQAALRRVANSVAPRYHATAERLLACRGVFVWDAVRATVSGYLSPASFRIQSAGQLPDTAGDPAYIIWARTNPLHKLFTTRRILAVANDQPIRAAAAGPEVHIYAYFDLEPTS